MQTAHALPDTLFDYSDVSLVTSAKEAIAAVMESGHPLIIGWSGGKDSTTILNLALTAAAARKANLLPVPHIVLTHADTLVENPEVAKHVRHELTQIRNYAKEHNIPLRLEIVEPALNDQLLVKIIGGRALPVFANKKERDCSTDLKVKPQKRLRKALLKRLRAEHKDKEPVTLIGTRFAESSGRKARMLERGEQSQKPYTTPNGELMLSPIAEWENEDVWEYLTACSLNNEPAYSEFAGLLKLYGDGSTAEEGGQVYNCRFGCCLCTVGRDKSLENMLQKSTRYHYMAGLNKLQRFLVNSQYDLTRRQWIGRTINDHGYIAIAPDVYSPGMLEELLRYSLTLDIKEKEAAAGLNIDPRFQLISAQALIAIDSMWSLQGLHPAHHALKIFRDIYYRGERYEIPEVPQGLPQKIPEPRYLHVGLGWATPGSSYKFCGLRNVMLEAVSEEGDGCMGTREVKSAYPEEGMTTILDIEVEPHLNVDAEAAHFIVDFELDYLLANYGDENRSRTSAYLYYTTCGCLSLAKGRHAQDINMILRRTAFKERHGLAMGPDFDLVKILDQTVSKKEMLADSTEKKACI